jgi:hypothetical protein
MSNNHHNIEVVGTNKNIYLNTIKMKPNSHQDDQEVFRIDSYPEGKAEERSESANSESTEEAQVVIEQMVRNLN